MSEQKEIFQRELTSAFETLARNSEQFDDAQTLIASSESEAKLKRTTIHKAIDIDWIETIERVLPALDLAVRKPSVMIEDVDEILPIEISRHITEKSIKHLAQHTYLIQDVDEDDNVIPSKILNIYHDETLLTYENKFLNTLVHRLFAFIDRRWTALKGSFGTSENYHFQYETKFSHSHEGAKTEGRIGLEIELTTPMSEPKEEADIKNNAVYADALSRAEKLFMTVLSYMTSRFIRAMGKFFIRPPVIRTNGILKNKTLRECLGLWEYIESYDKAGFSLTLDEFLEMPADGYLREFYSPVAVEYLQFFNSVVQGDNRLLSERKLQDMFPEFKDLPDPEEDDDYTIYDSVYKKIVPVSRLLKNSKALSDDETRIKLALDVALLADDLLDETREEPEYKTYYRIATVRCAFKRNWTGEEQPVREGIHLSRLPAPEYVTWVKKSVDTETSEEEAIEEAYETEEERYRTLVGEERAVAVEELLGETLAEELSSEETAGDGEDSSDGVSVEEVFEEVASADGSAGDGADENPVDEE